MRGMTGIIGPGANRAVLDSLLRAHVLGPSTVVTADGMHEAWLGHASLGIGGEDGGIGRRGPYLLAVAGYGPAPSGPDAARPLVERLLDHVIAAGPEVLGELDGVFAACLVDERSQTAILVNDRLGLARLYYRLEGPRLLIASRARALATGADFDSQAVGHLLQVGYPLADRTLFPGVRLLAPASFATWEQGRLLIRRTWEPSPPPPGDMSLDTAAELMHTALAAAVERNLDPGLPTVVPLSGGLDSRALLGMARQHGPVLTLSYGHEHSRDRRYGARLARIAGARHVTVPLGPDYVARYAPRGVYITDGEALATAFHIMCLNPPLATTPSLVLSGLLGEILSGAHLARVRPEEVAAPLATRARALYERRYRNGFTDEELRRLLRRPLLREIEGAAFDAFLQSYSRGEDAYAAAERAHLELRVHRFTAYQLSTLGAVAQVRAPFADREVLITALSMPVAARIARRAYRHFIVRSFPRLAQVPQTSTGLPLAGREPMLTFRRLLEWTRWRGLPALTRGSFHPHDYRQYAHYNEWIRTGARAFIADLIEDRAALGDLIDMDFVADLFRAHIGHRVDAHERLAAVATLALLRRQLAAPTGRNEALNLALVRD